MPTNLIYAAGSAWSVNVSPNSNGLPGGHVLQNITGGLMHWGLIASVAAVIIGALVWSLAGHGHNPHWASRGRMGALIGAGGGLLTGAAPAIVHWAAQTGQGVH